MREGRCHGAAGWIGVLALLSGCGLGNPDLVFSADVGVINPVDVPVDVPVDIGFDAGVDVPTDVPADVPVDVPVDIPTDTPVDVPVDVPIDVPVDVPIDVPVDVPIDVPVDVPPVCPAGQTLCGSTCFDLANDVNHCGSCTTACAFPNAVAACRAGACQLADCASGWGNCDANATNGCELDVSASNTNCGACGTTCANDRFCSDRACRPVRDCRELHVRKPTLPSGTYSVDLDAAGPGVAVIVQCDMITDGGGWTLAFDSDSSSNYDRPDVGWSRTDVSSGLIATSVATEALVAHRNAAFVPVTGVSTARFAIPVPWRTAAPFSLPGQDDTITVFLDGRAMGESRRLRYGHRYFDGYCSSAWGTTNPFGRFCLEGTNAPFYAAFTNSAPEYCANSSEPWYGSGDPSRCSASRHFTIYVR